jgi:hypothetical protein
MKTVAMLLEKGLEQLLIRFDVFIAVTMKDAVFWDMTMLCSSFKNRSLGGTYCLHLQG